MIRAATIFKTNSLSIQRFDHPRHCSHRDDEVEPTQDNVVTFVEQGVFELQQGSEWWSFAPRDVLLSTPGLRRRYRHVQECPDDVCLSLAFAPDLIEDALGRTPRAPHPPRIADNPTTRFAYRAIDMALRSHDALEIESAAFHATLGLNNRVWQERPIVAGASAHARQVYRACEKMLTFVEDDHSLTSVAREAGMSPFHFARTFTALVGEPPHQYLLRARLRRAAGLLRQGASVTAAAMDSGFKSMSHFSRMFYRRFGVLAKDYPYSSSQSMH